MSQGHISPLKRLLLLLLALAGCIWLLNSAYHRYLTTAYPRLYTEEVNEAATEFGVPASLIYAIILTESDFDPDAVSPANAKGLMQLTDDTYQWAVQRENNSATVDPKNLFDPATNIHYGVYVLTLLGEQFEDKATLLAAYNAGQGHVRSWLDDSRYSNDGVTLKQIPFKETRDYVRRVQDAQEHYRRLYE